MLKVVLFLVCHRNLQGMLVDCLVVFVLTIVLLELATVVFVVLFGMLVGVWFVLAALPKRVFWNGIMMVCQQTVSAGGFVLDALALAIHDMPISLLQSMAIQIWLFFTALAVTTASSVRIGITATYQPNISPS
jgi:hypothetical protein